MAVDLKLKLSIAKMTGETGEAVTHFDCRAIKGREAISEPYRFEASFLADDAALSAIRGKSIIGKRAWLTISAASSDSSGSGTDSTSPNESIFAGIILEFRIDAIMNAQRQYSCYVVLAPSISALNYNQVSNIFSTSETSKTDFLKGLLSSKTDNSTTGGHQQSFEFYVSSSIDDIKIALPDNITKYNETDFSFFSRMLEHYGIFYFFQYGKPGSESRDVKSDYTDKIRIGAQNADFIRFSAAPVACASVATTATDLLNPCVLSFSQVQRPHSRSFVVRDYNEAGPASDMLASSDVTGLNEGQVNRGIGSIVEYGDHFTDHNEGTEFAKIRAQELAWQASVFEGESTLMGLHAGMTLRIKGFASSNAEEYLVVSIEHSAAISNHWRQDLGLAEDERYRNRFVAIPSALQFRPKRQTPRPVMAGVFNAVVAGAPKKRAVLDGDDKYHVNLQFDESDKKHTMGTLNPSSVAVRQIEPYASSGVDGVASGLHFPLVPNTEVLMAYVNGDPDRPIIVGAAFNSINQNLVKSSSSTANRLRTAAGTLLEMEDGTVAGEEGNETRGPRYLRMDVPVSYKDDATSGNYFRMGAQASDETKDGKNLVATGLTNDLKTGPRNGIQLYTQDDLDVNVLGVGLMKFGKGHTTETSTGDSTHTVPNGQYVLTAQKSIIIRTGTGAQPGNTTPPATSTQSGSAAAKSTGTKGGRALKATNAKTGDAPLESRDTDEAQPDNTGLKASSAPQSGSSSGGGDSGFDRLKGAADTAGDGVVKAAKAIGDFAEDSAGKVKDFAEDSAGKVKDFAEGSVDKIKELAGDVEDTYDIVIESVGNFYQKSVNNTVFNYGAWSKVTVGETFSVYVGSEQNVKASVSVTLQLAGVLTTTLGISSTVTIGLKADVIIGRTVKVVVGLGDTKITPSDLKIAGSDSKFLTGEDFKVCLTSVSIVVSEVKASEFVAKRDILESKMNELGLSNSKVKAIKSGLENRFSVLTTLY